MLEFSNVTFKYENNENYLINNLNFNVDKGEFVSIIGPSGCGKSTIFRLILGLEKANMGKVNISEGIGYMPQKDLLIPWRNILENTYLPMEIQTRDIDKSKREASKLLDDLGFKEYKYKYPKDLSGGMRQRVSFIRTLLTGGNVMLLDEPFSALDAITKISMQEWLLDTWYNLKKTVLFITHDVEEALFLSNRIFVVTNSPISSLKEVKVPIGYPRNRHDLFKPEIIKIKEKLINELKQRVEI